MRAIFLLSLCFVAGCASQPRSARLRRASEPGNGQPVAIDLHPQVVPVETRYEVRGYYDGTDPSIWHAAHPVYRETLVSRAEAAQPPVAAGGPLTTFYPATYDPLPPNAELSAELAEQRSITANLRAMQSKMAVLQEQAQNQYQELVTGREDADRLRHELEGRVASAASAPPGSNPSHKAETTGGTPGNW